MAIVFSGVSFSGGFEIQPAYPPGAPTVGSATATGATTATVAFTAPTNGGSSTITSYTAISSPGNITGTLSQAGSGTITVSGLNDNTSYTFTVTATNSNGTSVPSASSNSITTPPLIPTRKAIFGYGYGAGSWQSMTNLVSTTGVVANDVTGVGTVRSALAAAPYGTDKAIFGYGVGAAPTYFNLSITNLVSNTGVVGNDVSGVGTARYSLAAAGYGGDKAIFGYGTTPNTAPYYLSMTNLVSNTGVVSNDTTGVGTGRESIAATVYGIDKAIFGYGRSSINLSITNLVSNTGVVADDTTGVGTARRQLAAAGYGTDKAIFGYGTNGGQAFSITNLVSNTGVVATDTTGVGTARLGVAAATYSTDKAIFGYGADNNVANFYSMTNLVSNTGVVASDTTGVGTARSDLAASSYSA